MNISRITPRSGEINLTHINEADYSAIVEIMRYYASGDWSVATNHPARFVCVARDILACLGKLEE